MDLASLKAELAGDAYKGLSAEAAAAAINAPTVTRTRVVATVEVQRLLFYRGRSGPLRAAAAAEPGGMADVMLDALATFTSFDLSDPQVADSAGALLDALVAANTISTDDKAALLALAATAISRAEELGWEPVQASDVAAARALDDAGNDADYAARAASVEARDRAWEAAKAAGADPAHDYDDWLNAYEAARRAG